MYELKGISPMIPSYDLQKTADFFKNLFQFKIAREEENYIILYRDHYTIHLLRAGADIGEMEFYLEVSGLDNLWESIKDKVERLKVKPPFDQIYGMREMHIMIPATKALMFVGEQINNKAIL